MTLTLKEKLNGCEIFHFFVSPYTDRTLKPFIYRDNAMRPHWLQLLEEIEHFEREKLRKPHLESLLNLLHDHSYFKPFSNVSEISTTYSQIQSHKLTEADSDKEKENKGTVRITELPPDDGSHVKDDKEHTAYPCDDKSSTIQKEKIMDKTNLVRGKGREYEEYEKEGNKGDKREGTKIKENGLTKNKLSSKRTIDFCYVREEHIRAINTLVGEHFWPNISMKECTLYPEFTVVALCKKLVVGLGAMIPNPNKHNETYITFLATRRCWQNAGIGSFMLYHLIATCQSTHITLHCSVSRFKALNLYFKFGFKVQCVVLNFYKPYLSSHPDVDMSPHAYFLKYSRNSTI